MEPAKIYTVQQGDSLSLISKKLYGDFSMVSELVKLNKITNENLIHPGQQLLVPDVKTTFNDDVEVVDSSTGKSSKGGKIFAWITVAVAAYLLGRAAFKQHKKNKKVATA